MRSEKQIEAHRAAQRGAKLMRNNDFRRAKQAPLCACSSNAFRRNGPISRGPLTPEGTSHKLAPPAAALQFPENEPKEL